MEEQGENGASGADEVWATREEEGEVKGVG